MHVFLLTVLIEAAQCDSHARTNQQPHRSTIVHLFEWKWKDVADECERFLGPKGFGAVQVSPPSENLIMHLKHLKNKRPWYERYRPMSYKINTRSGDEKEFVDMTARCKKVGVRIYADVVLNHMAGDYETNIGTAGSTADFKKYNYSAVPYTREHFHEPCTINFNIIKQVRECQLEGTKDLNHRNKHVRKRIIDYLKKLLDLGVAGFRIDAAKHIWPEDLRYIYSQLHNSENEKSSRSKPYIYHEVTFNDTGEASKPFEYTELGDVTDYRVGEELKNLFRGLDEIKLLYNWGPEWGLLPSENAVVSIDNHETQREDDVLSYKEAKAYKAAIAFILAHPYGKPRVMSSYYFDKWEQGPPSDKDGNILSPNSVGYNQLQQNDSCGNGWVCEHRWRQIYQMVAFRNAVRGTNVTHWWDNEKNLIAFSRGDKGLIAFNLEYDKDMNVTLKTALPPGEYCDVISGERDNDQCTRRKVIVTEKREGRRNANIRISAHDEDTHIAIHVGPESSLQADWTPSGSGGHAPTPTTVDRSTVGRSTVDRSTVDRSTVDRSTMDRSTVERSTVDRSTVDRSTAEDDHSKIINSWEERDPPLTSELPRSVTWAEQDENTRKIINSSEEMDPLPPLTTELPRSVTWATKPDENTRQTSHEQHWHRERDPLPPLTSEQPRDGTWKNEEHEEKEANHRGHRERDPLPPLTSDPANVVSRETQEQTYRHISQFGPQERDSYYLSSTSESASILAWEEQEKKGRLTSPHGWDRERNPLPPLTSESARIVVWKIRRKKCKHIRHPRLWQPGRRRRLWQPERDPLPPYTRTSN